ncbi:MAG: PilZ domain-containing protein [Clostridia bacterium]|nr:PilZ domain-containing protein [Deltaproteobacteria bacterium]
MGDTKFNRDASELDIDNTAEAYSPSDALTGSTLRGEAFSEPLSEDEALSLATDSVDLRALERHMTSSRADSAGYDEPAINWRSKARAAQMNDGTTPMRHTPVTIEPQLYRPDVAFISEQRPGRTVSTLRAGELASQPIVHTPIPPMMKKEPTFVGTEPIQVDPQQRTRPAHDYIEDAVEVDLSSGIVDDTTELSNTTDMAVLADEAAALETKVLAAGAIPPERVRFTAPLELMVEGDADLSRGAVLNMSATGIACAMDIELTPGQRVWVRFRLSLADEPISLLCAVIWRRGANESHVLYGLQFTSLSHEEAQRIETTVRERIEGRAADWPLPLIPGSGPLDRAGKASKHGGWTSAAFGMIGGMGLALALSALPHFSQPARTELTEKLIETRPVATAEALPPAPSAMMFGAQHEIPDAVAGKADTMDMPTIEPIATEPKLAVAPPAPFTGSAPVRAAETTKVAVKSPEATNPAATARADIHASGKEALLPRKPSADHAEVTLASGTSSTKPHAFWLENPHRYVVDVPGKHAAATSESPLVSKVRTGTYEDKTRYVFEVASNVHEARVELRGNALVVKLSK